jgi:predicted transposase/invertase (TIGR01784 family)
MLGNSEEDRKVIYDLYCHGADGSRFIVEMQKAKQTYFKDRTVYYSTFPIQEQAVQGEHWNYELKAVYAIAILDFVFNANNSKVIRKVMLKDDDNEVFYEKLLYVYLAMPNFKLGLNDLKTYRDKWLFVLKNLHDLSEIPVILRDGVFKKLFEVADIASLSREERFDYEQSLKRYRDFKNVTDTAKTEAKAEGRAEGIAEGKIEGKIEGKMEAAIEIAKKLLLNGAAKELVIAATGLSAADVQQIEKSVK